MTGLSYLFQDDIDGVGLVGLDYGLDGRVERVLVGEGEALQASVGPPQCQTVRVGILHQVLIVAQNGGIAGVQFLRIDADPFQRVAVVVHYVDGDRGLIVVVHGAITCLKDKHGGGERDAL